MDEYEYEVEIEVAVITKRRYKIIISDSWSSGAIQKAYRLKTDEVRKGEPLSKYDVTHETINVLGTRRK